MNNKISIVMPTYNNEKTIGNSIRSILQQNYSNWELIIVDDGSVDKTKKICDKFASYDTRIKYYKQKNSGVSSARNYGLHKINGDLLMFIDADDTLVCGAIKKLVSYFNDNKLDLCIFSWNEISDNKVIPHNYSIAEMNANKENFFRKIAYSSNWNDYSGGYPWNKIWRVNKIDKNGRIYFDERVSMLEDRLYVLACLDKVDKIKVINERLYNYYILDKSISHSKSNTILQANEIYKAVKLEYTYIKKKHSSAICIARKALFQGRVNYLLTIVKNKNMDTPQAVQAVKEFQNEKFQFINFKVSIKYLLLKIVLTYLNNKL